MIAIADRSDAVRLLTHLDHNSIGEFNVFVANKGEQEMTREWYDANLVKYLTEFLNQ